MVRVLSIIEDVCAILFVTCFFGALAVRSLGLDAGSLWAGMWASVGGLVLASGLLLKIGPGAIAKMVKARARAMAENQP